MRWFLYMGTQNCANVYPGFWNVEVATPNFPSRLLVPTWKGRSFRQLVWLWMVGRRMGCYGSNQELPWSDGFRIWVVLFFLPDENR